MKTNSETDIHRAAVAYLRLHSMREDLWQFTLIGEMHPQLAVRFPLASNEKVIVSSFVSAESWYVFTTRRMASQHAGVLAELEAMKAAGTEFGNFKGVAPNGGSAGAIPTEIGTLTHIDSGSVLRFEFETNYAAMVPIYACRFWERRAMIKRRAVESARTACA